MIDLCLLGTGGMMPLPKRYLSSMLVRYNGKMILFDCGEGTQISQKILGWGFKNVECICFTHFHADHISGLPGMLLTLGNCDREEKLKLAGPKGLKNVVEKLRVIAKELPYDIEYIELDEENNSFTIDDLIISSTKGNHTIDCLAYSIKLNRQGKFDVNKAKTNNVPLNIWSDLQKGEDVFLDNILYTPDMVLGEERRGIKLSFCTDTRPNDNILELIRDSNIFVCEGMYGEDEELSKAVKRKHMLFSEAAKLAKDGNVEELILTHYSPSIIDPEEHLKNAKGIFDNTIAGRDRMTRNIKFKD